MRLRVDGEREMSCACMLHDVQYGSKHFVDACRSRGYVVVQYMQYMQQSQHEDHKTSTNCSASFADHVHA